MSKTTQPAEMATELASIKEQESRNRELEIRLAAELDNINREYAAESEAVKAKFGTDNLDELREKYKEFVKSDRLALDQCSSIVSQRTSLLNDIHRRLHEFRNANGKG